MTERRGFVCRDHHDQPVTWRGVGCRLCPRRSPKRRRTKVTPDVDSWSRP